MAFQKLSRTLKPSSKLEMPNIPAKQNDSLIILNVGSGKRRQREAADGLRELGKSCGVSFDLVLVNGSTVLQAARNARKAAYERVIVGGGDGTINAVASELAGSDIRLGILPLGTFNFVARELGIPDDLEHAFRLCVAEKGGSISCGTVNDRIFLNSASIGFYAQVLTVREKTYRRWGRSRFTAYLSVLRALVNFRTNMYVKVKVNQQEQTLRTPMIFIGRNECQLREFALPGSDCVKNDGLVVYILPPVTRLGLLRLAIRLLHRGPELQKEVSYFCASSLEIDSRQITTTVAIDGERVKLQYPLKFGVAVNAISVISGVRESQASPESAA